MCAPCVDVSNERHNNPPGVKFHPARPLPEFLALTLFGKPFLATEQLGLLWLVGSETISVCAPPLWTVSLGLYFFGFLTCSTLASQCSTVVARQAKTRTPSQKARATNRLHRPKNMFKITREELTRPVMLKPPRILPLLETVKQ